MIAMALTIEDPEVDRLVRELAATTGESPTEALRQALRERIEREQGRKRMPGLREELRAIRERCAMLPVIDARSPEEIIGYGDSGIPC
jgi:antitoxin VapB